MPRERKVYVELEHVLNNMVGTDIRLEDRNVRWKFGTHNYGEVVENWYNRADKDRWDVFTPGYTAPIPVGTYECTAVIGVLLLANDNHKIAVRVSHPGYTEDASRQEIKRYIAQYCQRMKLRGMWMSLQAPITLSN